MAGEERKMREEGESGEQRRYGAQKSKKRREKKRELERTRGRERKREREAQRAAITTQKKEPVLITIRIHDCLVHLQHVID